ESFYGAVGLPAKISPLFSFSYDNSNSFVLKSGFFLGKIRILTESTEVYTNTTNNIETVEISHAKGYLGNLVTFKLKETEYEIETILLNGVALSENQIESLTGEGLTVPMTGNMHLNVTYVNPDLRTIEILPTLNGEIVVSHDEINVNNKVRILVFPAAGYKLKSLKQNGLDITHEVKDNVAFATILDNTTFEVEFDQASIYYVENGALSS